jgi:hypothetical protein
VGKGTVKVNFSLEQAIKFQRVEKVYLHSLTSAINGVGCKPQAPFALLAGKQPAFGWPHIGFGRMRKISSPPGFDSRKDKIKNCLKVTSKHKTKITVDKANNLMKLKYVSFFLPLFVTV